MAADLNSVVQETEATLQLLQKRVPHLFVVKQFFFFKSQKKIKMKVLGLCLQLRRTLVHVAVWSTKQQNR